MKAPDIDTLLNLAKDAPDHYALHLAEVNKETDVLATEDIYNNKGVLVARKGSRIDHNAATRLVQHKLFKPLDQQVQLNDSLDKNTLYQATLEVLNKYPDLAQIHAALQFDQPCREVWAKADIYPLMIQKLSVMMRRLPKQFENALFCGWLSVLVAREMGMGLPTACSALLAGLIHDVGFLHIPSGVLGKKGALSAEEWRAIQSHVVIGQVFVESISGVNPIVARAVLEHHERCDGTGYPLGRGDERLEVLGKVVGLTDSVYAIRVNQFQKTGRTLRDLMPYLQMNDTTYSLPVYRAMMAILKKSGLESSLVNSYGTVRAMAQFLRRRAAILLKIRELLQAFHERLQERTAGQKISAACSTLIAVLNNVLMKTTSAGLEGDDILQWLDGCAQDDDAGALRELNELELMENELFWHIGNVQRTAGIYFNRECPEEKDVCRPLHEIMRQIGAGLAEARALR